MREDISGFQITAKEYALNEKVAVYDIVKIKFWEYDIKNINRLYLEVTIRNLVNINSRLSDYKQNPQNYRCCMLDIPGISRDDIFNEYLDIKDMFGYRFKKPVLFSI